MIGVYDIRLIIYQCLHVCVIKVFAEWNKSELDSFLIEITRDILKFKDEEGDYLVEKIRDTAGQVSGSYSLPLSLLLSLTLSVYYSYQFRQL